MSDTPRLDRWLAEATRGLSEESKRRVSHELREHHRDAMASGSDDATAVRDLGPPDVARRAFRRTYLTAFEEALVRDYRGRPQLWRIGIYLSLVVVLVAVTSFAADTPTHRSIGWALVLLVTTAFISLVSVAPRLYRSGRERLAVPLGAIADFVLYAGTIVGTNFVSKNSIPASATLFAAIFLLLLALYLPLLRKLRNAPRRRT